MNAQLGKSEDKVKGLSKRIGDVSGYYTQRKAETAALQAQLKSLGDSLGKIRSELPKLKLATPKIYAKQVGKLDAAEKAYGVARDKWQASLVRDAEIRAVPDQARILVGDLNKIPFQGAKTVLDGLRKFKPSSADDVLTAVDTLSSLSGAVGSVGMAKTPA